MSGCSAYGERKLGIYIREFYSLLEIQQKITYSSYDVECINNVIIQINNAEGLYK